MHWQDAKKSEGIVMVSWLEIAVLAFSSIMIGRRGLIVELQALDGRRYRKVETTMTNSNIVTRMEYAWKINIYNFHG